MSRRLTASGAFKRMSGDWLPATDVRLYQSTDQIFRKRTVWPVYDQVGGGDPGSRPTESARILFWDAECPLCEINLVNVLVRTGLANNGQLVLTMSSDKDFETGWFVSVESIVSQIAVPLLTLMDDGKRRINVSGARLHTRRYDADPIAEGDAFISWAFPSLNLIGFSEDAVQHAYSSNWNDYERLGALDTLYGTYLNAVAIDRQLPAASEAMQFTARVHKITCGTVSSGSRNTLSTQSVWTGIQTQSYPQCGEMWLGLGDNFVKAGVGRRVFLPSMSLTQTERDRLQQTNRYWKVDAIPGPALTIKDPLGSGRTIANSGIGALGASGTFVLGTRVTESPKARSKRSSLVTSPQGLVWGGGFVVPGINRDHTEKAVRLPATVFPFDQPQQAVAISIGADKARPSSLTARFTTTSTKEVVNYTNGTFTSTPVALSDDRAKPRATVRQILIQSESGRIGRQINGWDGVATDYKEVPQKEPWVGVFDSSLQVLYDRPATDPIIFNAGYWYGGSNQTQNWRTFTNEEYSIELESLRGLPYCLLDGQYVGTNVMPDGSLSAFDNFYAAPQLPEVSSVPTLSEPLVLNPIVGVSSTNEYYTQGLNYSGFIPSVFEWSQGVPFLYEKQETYGSGTYNWLNAATFDPNHRSVQYSVDNFWRTRAAGWSWVNTTHANTPTKLSAELTYQAERAVQQTVLLANSEANETPRSEFYKANPSQFNDFMTRLCAAARITVVKSCRWIPKQTQMFMAIDRATYSPVGGVPGGWGYYGGEVSEADKLEMLDKYETVRRTQTEPTGGRIVVYLRRTWQIEVTIATGSPTYVPMEVISDDLTTVSQDSDARYGGVLWNTRTFHGTRRAKCKVEFDIENAETVTHVMNHQQIFTQGFGFDELEWEQLEAGVAIEKQVIGTINDRVVPSDNGMESATIRSGTKVVFQFT